MPNHKMFDEVSRGQKFIDPETNQLCRKLFANYVNLVQVAFLSVDKDGELAVKEIYHRNAIVESTGELLGIPSERQVRVFI